MWEDYLLERKVESDLKDLLKTLVAFSNSIKPGHIAQILIGEKDDGTIDGVKNPDNIQKTIRKECDKIYPPIIWQSILYKKKGKTCIRIEIEYSGETPHFGGPAWIRKGSETIKATDEIFQKLITLRLNIVQELSKWLNKVISIRGDHSTVPEERIINFPKKSTQFFQHRWEATITNVKIIEVNNYWVTFEKLDNNEKISEPLQKLVLNYDNKNDRLLIYILY